MALGPPSPSGSENKALGQFALVTELHRSFFGPLWLAYMRTGVAAGSIATVRRIVIGEVDRAAAEAVAAAADQGVGLSHDRLLPLLAVASDDEEVGLASAYVEAEPLRSVLRLAGIGRQPVPAAIALRMGLDLLEGLEYLHAQTIEGQPLLGALTPDNVMVGSDGVTRISEPVASVVASLQPVWEQQPKRACYDAPEQMDARRTFDPRSDLFAVGVMLWEMLRNRPLFGGSTYEAVAERVKTAAIRRADSLKPAGGEAIPASVADIVDRALARSTADRYGSAAEMAAAVGDDAVASHAEVAAFVQQLASESLDKLRQKLEQTRAAAATAGDDEAAAPPPKPTVTTGAARQPVSLGDRRGLPKKTLVGMTGPTSTPRPAAGPAVVKPAAEHDAPAVPAAERGDGQGLELFAAEEDDKATVPPSGLTPAIDERRDDDPDLAAERAALLIDGEAEKKQALSAPPLPKIDVPEEAAGAGPAVPVPPAGPSGKDGAAYDVLSIADDPSGEEELPEAAKKVLYAAKKQQPAASRSLGLVIGAATVVAVAAVGGYLLVGGMSGAQPGPSTSVSATASATAAATATTPASSPAPATSSGPTAAPTESAAAADAGADAAAAEATASGSAATSASAAPATTAPATTAPAAPSAAPSARPSATVTRPPTPKPSGYHPTTKPKYVPGGI